MQAEIRTPGIRYGQATERKLAARPAIEWAMPKSPADVAWIGDQPIYRTVPRYVAYDLPFVRYTVTTPFGVREINVSRIYLAVFGEALAVPMTAWGALREQFRFFDTAPLRNAMRDDFIARVTFERRF